MSSSSSVSSSSSSPLPTSKTPSNRRSKNNKKDNISKEEVISSSQEASSKSSENNKSSSSIITQDHTKSSEICSSPFSEDKKKDVINCNGNTNSLDSFRKMTTEESTSDTLSNLQTNNKPSSLEGSVKRSPTAKEELDYLASVLDFSVTYTNFPQKNKTDVVTLVKLTTNPPKVKSLSILFCIPLF